MKGDEFKYLLQIRLGGNQDELKSTYPSKAGSQQSEAAYTDKQEFESTYQIIQYFKRTKNAVFYLKVPIFRHSQFILVFENHCVLSKLSADCTQLTELSPTPQSPTTIAITTTHSSLTHTDFFGIMNSFISVHFRAFQFSSQFLTQTAKKYSVCH